MLKTTEPKILVEASTDRLWGTGVSITDTHVLDSKKWYGRGWLLDMLQTVRESYQEHSNIKLNGTTIVYINC